MISRLTTCATLFSVFAAASLTFAATAQQTTIAAPTKQVRVVELERVVVVGKRMPRPAI